MGFAMIWHIRWLAAFSFIGDAATFVSFAWRDTDEYRIPAAEVARIDQASRSVRLAALARLGVAK
jgi:cytochrome o ubiquinol oxidase subunit 1